VTGALAHRYATLGSDVSMPSSGTWYNGPSIEITAGTWIINANVTMIRTVTTVTQWVARLFDGTNGIASGQVYGPSVANHAVQIALTARITVTGTTTITLQGTTNAGNAACLIKAATAVSGSGNHATAITAIRVE
jgi:hypothetical protein